MATHTPTPDPAPTATPAGKPDVVEIERARSAADDDLDPKAGRVNYDAVDAEVAKYISTTRIDISAAENSRLRKLIDKRVLAIMVATYFLQAIDKGTMSFASIMGIIPDTGLVDQQYSWLTTCIYITILIVEYPQNYIIARVPVAKYLGFMIVAWGAVLACTAACHNFAGLVAVRTLLGLFESACQPAFVVLSSMWYKREEQPYITAIWYGMNGAQQIVGGLLAYCFSLIGSNGPLKSWQWLFLSYGIVSVFFGAFVFWWMPDSPMRAKCFTEADKHLIVERVRANQTGIQNRVFKKAQAVEALTDPQVWGYALVQLCTTLPTSGLGSFQGLIIKGLGFTVLQTQLLAMVLGFYIIFVLFSSAFLARKTGQNLLVMVAYVLPSFVGTICFLTVPTNTLAQKVGLLISFYLCMSFWAAQTLALSMVSRNIAGQTKKSVAIATSFVIWATGNAIGPQVYLSWDAPHYRIAWCTHLGCYSLLVIVILSLRVYLKHENSKKDALAAAGVHEANDAGMVHAFEDLTDKENPNFRYVY